MNVGAVLFVLGRLCTLLAMLLMVPTLLCAAYGGFGTPVAHAFLVTAFISLGIGWALRLSFDFDPTTFGFGEAFATVTLSWLVFTALAALPFLITGQIRSVVDACFETLSGFTTTGASILADPAALDPPLLFWRAMTHWIGGMGIVALSVAVLPALGAGGNFLFQAEVPGPESEKLLPRISSTSKLLWTVYLSLTAVQFLLLWMAGMTPFDSICHTFATVSTGGFGTRADSMASFSPTIQWITVVFMVLSALNFVLFLSAMRGRPGVLFRDTEARVFVLILVGVSGVALLLSSGDGGVTETGIRNAVFTTVSLFSCTGFVNNDYSGWPPVLHVLLLLGMVVGGCVGSTAGGAKVLRLVLLVKTAMREVRRLLRPSAVFVVKVQNRAVEERLVGHTLGYFALYLFAMAAGALILLVLGYTADTSFSAMITCLGNIGPGFGAVGPAENFGGLTDTSKQVLMAAMLLGRLEFYSVIVLFLPLAWRR